MEVIDEVDECVVRFRFSPEKTALLVGKEKTTVKSISSNHNVRIGIPMRSDIHMDSTLSHDNTTTSANIQVKKDSNRKTSTDERSTRMERRIENQNGAFIELEGEVPDVFQALESLALSFYNTQSNSRKYSKSLHRKPSNKSRKDQSTYKLIN